MHALHIMWMRMPLSTHVPDNFVQAVDGANPSVSSISMHACSRRSGASLHARATSAAHAIAFLMSTLFAQPQRQHAKVAGVHSKVQVQ